MNKSPHIERNRRILEALESGKKQADVARDFCISSARVSQIVRRAEWDKRKGDFFEPSVRLLNCMKNEGFVPRVQSLNFLRDVKPNLKAFYDHIMEELPEEYDETVAWRRSPIWRRGPRWIRLPNIGPKTVDEVRLLLGIDRSIPVVEPPKDKITRLESALARITTTTVVSECQRIAREALGE